MTEAELKIVIVRLAPKLGGIDPGRREQAWAEAYAAMGEHFTGPKKVARRKPPARPTISS